jgi:nicotinamide riboside kinase
MLINLIGGEATGKSTLAHALGVRLDAVVVPEALRAFVDVHGRAPRVDEQASILRDQAEAERIAIAESQERDRGFVIGDPAPIMTAVYSQLYYDDSSLFRVSMEVSPVSDVVVWCSPDFEWTPDLGQRDGPEFRDAADVIIRTEVIPLFQAARINVLQVTGSIDERLNQVLAHLT